MDPDDVTVEITSDEYIAKFVRSSRKYQLIDVREPDEFAEGHLAGAVNVPLSALEKRYEEISQDNPVVLVCARGARSAMAGEYLATMGYESLFSLIGGTLGYVRDGHNIEK